MIMTVKDNAALPVLTNIYIYVLRPQKFLAEAGEHLAAGPEVSGRLSLMMLHSGRRASRTWLHLNIAWGV